MIDEILGCMAVAQEDLETQEIQTRHRMRLVETFRIEPGDHILEIGCGQGDTTAVLAYLVGETGFVHGIDIAEPDYGAPVSVGDSAKFLMASPLGSQIRMDYETDFLRDDGLLLEEGYDLVILSHSSWYMKSQDELLAVLKKARRVADRICFAEADVRIGAMDQMPHLLAVLIQAQMESVKDVSISNIRTLVTRDDAARLMEEAGWTVVDETLVKEEALQDGDWETQYTLHEALYELEDLPAPSEKWRNLIYSMGELLKYYEDKAPVAPLGSFVLIGE